ncbi:MAG: hypothetical protein AAGH40_08630 [Verrucomicrobiota bacterium]
MRHWQIIGLLLSFALQVGCFNGRSQLVADVDGFAINDPQLWISRVFGEIVNGHTTSAVPLSGETIRFLVSNTSSSGEWMLHLADTGSFKPDAIEVSPIVGTSILAWRIPENLEPKDYALRLSRGEDSSSWIDFVITTPALLAERQTISAMANALKESQREGVKLFVDYNPMSEGTIVFDGASGEKSYGPARDGEWLVYGVRPDTGLAQPDAFWAVGNPVEGLTVAANPIGPIGPIKPVGWPEPESEGRIYYAIRDFSIPINTSNQFFEAAPEGAPGRPIQPEENPPPGDPPSAPPVPVVPTGFGVTGDLGRCPDGIKTVGIVLQLDDNSGFDWLLGKTGEVLTEMGATAIERIPTESVANRRDHKFNPQLLAARLQSIAAGLECDCEEVILSIICHGTVKRDGTHLLVFKNRYPNRDRDQPDRIKRERIPTADIMELVAKAFHDAGRDCVPITVLLQPCYTGAALDEIPEAVERGAGGARENFRVITAASEDQPAYGRWDGGDGLPEIYFLEALRSCLKDLRFDINGDGRVTLQEAWPCLLEEVWLRAMGGSRKEQNPKKWPNP